MFKEKISKLQKKFREQGPGAEGTVLETGAEAVKKFSGTLAKYNSTREELVLAEKLFNLSITSYPELVEIENEIKGFAQIFQLYADFQEAQAKWANTLWAELDVSVLTAGVDAFLQRLKKLPKELQQTFPYKTLFEKINSFKDSIPLFADLKNEALRPRHWKTLMDVTGKSFQTNSKTFTLEAVFGMELHKYSDKIAEITSGAVKELSIEQGIQTIADTWKNLRFEVVKYLKGTEDRGFILKGIDDVQTLLDDNSMSLQAMSISRYMCPLSRHKCSSGRRDSRLSAK
jgi:dynein heavy chain